MSYTGTFGHTPSTDPDYVAASAGSSLNIADIYASAFTLDRPVTVPSLAMRTYSGSGDYSGYMALYATSGGVPTTKLTQIQFTSQTLAANTTYTFALATPLELDAGDYAIAVFLYARSGGTATLAYDASGTQFYAAPGGVAPPASWPGSYTTQTRTAHVWANYTAETVPGETSLGLVTAEEIINDACIQLGLRSTEFEDPYTSTDSIAILMVRLLKGLGRRLYRARAWGHLIREHSFSTVVDTDTYALPDDFARPVTETQWDRTGTRALFGPETPSSWAEILGRADVGGTWTTYRVLSGQLVFRPVPSSVATIAFEYITRWWVRHTADTEPTDETPSASTDILYFDSQLLVAGLKLEFLRVKGFDTSAAQEEFNQAWTYAVGADSPGRTLYFNGRRGPRLLSWCNAPEGSWGS